MIWKLDTCKCVFEYNGSNIVANLTKIINLCPEHNNHDDAKSDNVIKNQAVTKMHEVLTLIDPATIPTEIGWSFNKQRDINISIPNRVRAKLTNQHLQIIETELTKISPKIKLS